MMASRTLRHALRVRVNQELVFKARLDSDIWMT
jgi:hypothetical protein